MSDNCKAITRAELERENQHLKEVIALDLALRDKALALQALEYERRLEVLNGAHAAAEKAVALTVPRDLYDAFMGQYNKWKQEMAEEFATIKATSATNTRFFTVLTALLSLLFSGLTLWMRNK